MKITGIESNKEILKEIGNRIKRQRINMGIGKSGVRDIM